MYARSSTYNAEISKLDDGIAYCREEVMPMLADIDGCIGLSMMVDRDAGQCIATTSWQDEESMRASQEKLSPVRDRLGRVVGGIPTVEEWEIAVMHRDHLTHAGTCCRVTWLRTNHDSIDRGIEVYRSMSLPRIEALDGFCSASLMVNRELGRACSTASFDSMAALELSREESWAIRDAGVREAGVDVIDVTEFELSIAHLRVPELV